MEWASSPAREQWSSPRDSHANAAATDILPDELAGVNVHF